MDIAFVKFSSDCTCKNGLQDEYSAVTFAAVSMIYKHNPLQQ